MGKILKGKECGKSIYQRKDGLYSARYYSKYGKRREKYFDTLPEARNWLADARYEDRHNLTVTSPDMTVDSWFNFLGHASIKTTMDRYVHVTDESLLEAVRQYEDYTPEKS